MNTLTNHLGFHANGQQYSFMVIDDCVYMTKTITTLIEGYGGQIVYEANSEMDAIKKIKQCKHDVDVVTLDLSLNGLELIPHIRKGFPRAKIIIISANATEENLKIAMLLGAKYFISKPFDKSDFYKIIKNSCRSTSVITTSHQHFLNYLSHIAIYETDKLIKSFLFKIKTVYPCKILITLESLDQAFIHFEQLEALPTLLMIDHAALSSDELDILAQITKTYPKLKIAVTSPSLTNPVALRALSDGAHYLVQTPLSEKNLASAIVRNSDLINR